MSRTTQSVFGQHSPERIPDPRRRELSEWFLSSPRLGFEEPESATRQSSLNPVGSMTGGALLTGVTTLRKTRFAGAPDITRPIVLLHWSTGQEEAGRMAEHFLAEGAGALGAHVFGSSKQEILTPRAERHARNNGVYGSVVLAKETVHEVMPFVRGMTIDLATDPEAEDGDPMICFHLAVAESVDRMLELDDALQRTLYDRLPVEDRAHFSFVYDFE